MDAMQFLRGVDNPLEPYTLPHLGLVPSYQRNLDAIYPGEDSRQRAYDVTRADFERLLGLGRVDMLKGFIASRLSGTMYEDINELAFALGRSVDELQYYLNVDPLELLRQAEAQQEAVRLAQIAADNERIRLQQEAERLAAEEAQRQSIAEAQRIVAETAAIDAARTAQLIAQSEARLRDEVREQWPAGDIDRQITLYEQLRTQPPRSDAEVQSIIRDAIGDGAEFQLLMRYINNWRAGIEPAETFRQIQIEQAEAEQYERLAPIREARAQAQAQLQYLAETGLVPVDIMIETGAWSQEQIEIARQVQADRLAKEQAAFQAEIDRQDAERSARVQAEIAQAAADEAERVRLYIADQRAKAQAEYDAQQAALEAERARVAAAQTAAKAAQAAQAAAQAAAPLATEEAVMIDLEAVIAQGQADFNAAVRAIRSKMAEIATARVNGQSYALPMWSVDYPTIPADLVESLLAQFGLPSVTELEAELAASQAAASGVDQSRGIDATIVVTAPAAPSDTVSTAPDKYDFSNWVGNQVSSGNTRQDAKTLYQTFIDMFTSGQNLPVKNLQEVLLNLRMGDLSAAVILSKFVYDNLTNAEVRSEFIKAYSGYGASVDELNVYVDYFLNYIGPDVTAPVVTTPVVTTPVVTTPVVTTPVVTTPVVTTPVVTTPVVTAPAVVTPAVVTPLIVLPDDWDTYSESRKIAWFNANQIKPSQLIAAGVPASDIAYMRANGYTVKEQAPAAGGGAALLLALASAYFLGA